MLGSDSTCFMLRLMMRANLYVILLGVLSIIASIYFFFIISVCKDISFS